MNPLYINSEGYEEVEDCEVNTILGVVFPIKD